MGRGIDSTEDVVGMRNPHFFPQYSVQNTFYAHKKRRPLGPLLAYVRAYFLGAAGVVERGVVRCVVAGRPAPGADGGGAATPEEVL